MAEEMTREETAIEETIPEETVSEEVATDQVAQEEVAPDQTTREEIWFDSTDGTSKIHGYIWWPASDQRVGVVQLVHGMAEYIGRYDAFARFLAEHGYVVCGHDHIGHGQSCDPSLHGKLPLREGKAVLVGDVDKLRTLMAERVSPELPYFIFGHSMGSFVVRSYIAGHGEGLAGAIVCGTGFIPPATSSMGQLVAKVVATFKGADSTSGLLDSLSTGGYAKAIKNIRTPLDWLSYDEKNVDDYIADADCGFSFSAGGIATLTSLTREVCDKVSAARVPKDLPLLYIAGDADPVGDAGKGVQASVQLVKDAGVRDVTCIIYGHMRHEILNEAEHKKVFDDVLAWLEDRR